MAAGASGATSTATKNQPAGLATKHSTARIEFKARRPSVMPLTVAATPARSSIHRHINPPCAVVKAAGGRRRAGPKNADIEALSGSGSARLSHCCGGRGVRRPPSSGPPGAGGFQCGRPGRSLVCRYLLGQRGKKEHRFPTLRNAFQTRWSAISPIKAGAAETSRPSGMDVA